eukprot:7206851-Alexandrium_andersonii.AAC.1
MCIRDSATGAPYSRELRSTASGTRGRRHRRPETRRHQSSGTSPPRHNLGRTMNHSPRRSRK